MEGIPIAAMLVECIVSIIILLATLQMIVTFVQNIQRRWQIEDQGAKENESA